MPEVAPAEEVALGEPSALPPLGSPERRTLERVASDAWRRLGCHNGTTGEAWLLWLARVWELHGSRIQAAYPEEASL